MLMVLTIVLTMVNDDGAADWLMTIVLTRVPDSGTDYDTMVLTMIYQWLWC